MNECTALASYGTLNPSSPDTVGGSTGAGSIGRNRFDDLNDGAGDGDEEGWEEDEEEADGALGVDAGGGLAADATRGMDTRGRGTRNGAEAEEGGVGVDEKESVRLLGGVRADCMAALSVVDMPALSTRLDKPDAQ